MAKKQGIYQHLSTLSDPLRVRLLRLLGQEELAVGELARIVQQPQSTVSRHLKALWIEGWALRRSEGPASYFRRAELDASRQALFEVVDSEAPAEDEDVRRLERVLALRHHDAKGFFGRVSERWDALRQELFGEAFTLPSLLGLLPPDWVIADLGCGTGANLEALAPCVARVVGIDREQAMLTAARKRLQGVTNVQLLCGDLDAVPLEDDSVDAVLFVLVLHHALDPGVALAEARRIVRNPGRIVVVDMVAHDREHYRHTMGHEHLGFSEDDLSDYAGRAGLSLERHTALPPEPEAQGPGLFLATLSATQAP